MPFIIVGAVLGVVALAISLTDEHGTSLLVYLLMCLEIGFLTGGIGVQSNSSTIEYDTLIQHNMGTYTVNPTNGITTFNLIDKDGKLIEMKSEQ